MTITTRKTARFLMQVAGGAALLGASSLHAQLATNMAVDVKAMSMGNAVTADPPGIMAIHFNPAGLAKLEGRRMDLQFLGADFSIENTFSAPPGYEVFGYSDDPVVCADAPDNGASYCNEFKEGKSTVEGITLYMPIINDAVDLPPGPLVAGPLPFRIQPPCNGTGRRAE